MATQTPRLPAVEFAALAPALTVDIKDANGNVLLSVPLKAKVFSTGTYGWSPAGGEHLMMQVPDATGAVHELRVGINANLTVGKSKDAPRSVERDTVPGEANG